MSARDPDELTIPPDGRPMAEQPQWRQDFPIDVPQDQYVARREFTKFMVLTSFAFVAGQAWILAKTLLGRRSMTPAQAVTRFDAVPVGGSLQFDFPAPGQPKLLVRLDERTVVAFDQRCTHLSCPVLPQVDQGRFHCPCHQGNFDIATGRPLSGPPRRPLPRVELEIRDGVVWAVGITERTS
ncbi:MAG: Rieske (2Fe-2S) protein [Thermoanaerobaculia bacterium]